MFDGFIQWLGNLSLMFSSAKWASLGDHLGLIFSGLGITIVASVLALALALVLGIVFGVLSASNWKPLRAVARVYVEFFQNTPLMLQVVFLGFGLPIVWPQFNAVPVLMVGVIGVGIYHGAYISEAVRAGIQSISKGQLEASLSQGMSYVQAMRHVVIPQALTVVLPPLTNQAVNLIKNTSVLLYIGAFDLMYQAKSIQAANYNPGPVYLVAMVLYFCLCYPLAFLAKRLEDRAEAAQGGGQA
ncbi:MAG: amino acid ABC transporter permease [Actinomycetes bacterium]|jgi:putative glutamine transport system permease protein|nr:amino acid ABC transporter permease [Actinomycetes bacterium]